MIQARIFLPSSKLDYVYHVTPWGGDTSFHRGITTTQLAGKQTVVHQSEFGDIAVMQI